jgi:hypothetical protein
LLFLLINLLIHLFIYITYIHLFASIFFIGAHFALPWLTQLRESLLKIKAEELCRKNFNGISRVQPEKNHLYSGRNNDDKVNFSEIFYFFSKIIPKVLFTSKLGGGEDCDTLKK